jgi:hypothetical protein
MALKDWKKTVDEKYSIIFKNTRTSNYVQIFPKLVGRGRNLVYSVIHYRGDRTFKTKSEALKYAKEYMKNH